jgi:hypothetical protein
MVSSTSALHPPHATSTAQSMLDQAPTCLPRQFSQTQPDSPVCVIPVSLRGGVMMAEPAACLKCIAPSRQRTEKEVVRDGS